MSQHHINCICHIKHQPKQPSKQSCVLNDILESNTKQGRGQSVSCCNINDLLYNICLSSMSTKCGRGSHTTAY